MRNQTFTFLPLNLLISIFPIFFLFSCVTSKWMVPSEYVGNWESSKNKITVRYKHNEQQDSQFISDSAIVKIQINSDKTVSGFIGQAAIDNGKIVKSWSFPGLREVEYSIECHLTGKIFDNDPLDDKEVDIWLSSPYENGQIKADLRKGGSVFPMALIILSKVKEQGN